MLLKYFNSGTLSLLATSLFQWQIKAPQIRGAFFIYAYLWFFW